MNDLFGKAEAPAPRKPEKPKPITKPATNYSTFDLSKTRPYRILRSEKKPNKIWIINTDTP